MSPAKRSGQVQRLGNLSGACVLLSGAGLLLGWGIENTLLKNTLPHWSTIGPLPALAFSLAGFGLWCAASNNAGALPNKRSTWRQRLCQVCAAVVAVIGALGLTQYLLS